MSDTEYDTDTTLRTEAGDNDALRILLIEDNPGDARLIEEMLGDSAELAQRVNADESAAQTPDITRETRLEDGLDVLRDEQTDIVLLDLNLPDSTGIETLELVHEQTGATPIVVLTGVRDQQIGVQAIQQGAEDFLVKDEVTSELLVRTIYHAIERARQQRERQRQREQLETYNRLNRIAHDITHAVITTETRTELEQRVCDRLVDDDAYRFAWIGEVNPGSDRVVPKAMAGIGEDYAQEIEVTVDEDEPTGQGPSGTAIRTESVQVMNDIHTNPAFEPWHEQAAERGYQSSAAIPIVHEDLVYGVLNIYSEQPRAFTDPETTVFARMGDVIAHAITAIERRDALVSDAVVELEFQASDIARPLTSLTETESCRIEIGQLVHGDESLLTYGTGYDIDPERFESAVTETDGIDDVRLLATRRDEFEFELVTSTAMSMFETIATHGGRVESVTIADGEFRFVIELPRGRDTRQMIELIANDRDDVTHLAQRTTDRSGREGVASISVLKEELTEKQKAALETAFYAGYFDWPRGSTGEEIAERLGIAPATFNQHLRTAERKFFESVLGE
ncbi:response regulator [Salinadaptatus halalkaliphilus]|uniref:Response regulator n=1 Tax=Salinadaptatus halalkaliphilus TaxID=2419781 RepID=A0A4S3TPQ2_9EURY|nr:bacterio-opsin activator domain-containing protein [Salinadaptatus halalkaliphilus]THE66344.1 response regulator [Salinadaptatus halalkaliphilus]